MTGTSPQARQDRSPGVSYQDLVATHSHDVPTSLRIETDPDFGPADIPAHFYWSREVAALEKERIWFDAWQGACREELIPEIG